LLFIFPLIKSLYILLVFIFTIGNLNSQTKWEWSHPKGTGNDLFGFDFADDMTGYACGDLGSIIKTTDGGVSWTGLKSGVNYLLYNAKCINKDTVLVVGLGQSLRTTDGGQTWNTFFVTPGQLIDINFLNNQTGYVAGSNGGVFKTTNSGWQWTQLSSAGNSLLTRCSFFNEQYGIVTGQNRIYLTSNGGANWVLQNITYLPPLEFVEAVQYFDSNFVCFVKTFERKFYYSTNHGVNWNTSDFTLPMNESNVDIPRSLYFKNRDTGIIVTDFGRVLRTTNGGLNWNLEFTTLRIYRIKYEFKKLWMAGKGGTMAYLDSIFNNLTVQSGGINSLNDMCVVNENVVYACGDRGDILKTTNQGMSWLKLKSGNTTRLNGISFINENTGFVVGDSGLFYKTTNGGNNWNSVNNISGRILLRVHFFNENEGVVTGRGIILKTFNGGISFDTIYSGLFNHSFAGLEFFNNTTGFIGNGRILRTTNAGNSYTEVGLGSSGSGDDITILDSNNLLTVTGIYIFRSTNFGINWTRYFPSGNNSFFTCDYTTNGNLFLGGVSGKIYKSYDHGNSLERYDSNFTNQTLYKVRFVNANTGFIVGQNGIILKTTNGGLTSISSNNQILNNYNINIFPNPVNPTSVLEVKLNKTQNLNIILYDITGREIRKIITGNLPAGVNRISIDLTSFSSGVYFCVVKSGDISLTSKKIVKLN